jgi:uncharacterized protein YjeT (DUF2065 family)
MRTRFSLCYVAGYLTLSGLALVIAPKTALRFMFATHDYGEIMPRRVAKMSVAMGAFILRTVRHRLSVLYLLGFFMPLTMIPSLAGLYLMSRDPLFLTLLAVVGTGVVLTGFFACCLTDSHC